MIKKCALALTLCCSQAAFAADNDFSLPDNWSATSSAPLMLASADNSSMTTMANETGHNYQDRMITANKIHKYLGIGSLGAAVLAGASPKEEDGAHENFARAATALGVGAVITGLIFHWDDFDLSNGIDDPDNIHLALTTLGTLGYASAVSEAPESGHAGPGVAGAISMAIGIKMVW